MGKISRRSFLNDTLFLMSSALLLPSSLPHTKAKTKKETRKYPSYLELEKKRSTF